ncbi:MAG: hypothetical protein LUG85_03045 [Clostridiales bacterium]|nr:hypothetical protein [Clostridiales bacterium]
MNNNNLILLKTLDFSVTNMLIYGCKINKLSIAIENLKRGAQLMDANFFAKLLQWIADFVSEMITLIQELAAALGIGGDDDTTVA